MKNSLGGLPRLFFSPIHMELIDTHNNSANLKTVNERVNANDLMGSPLDYHLENNFQER